ncbi:MAG: hypothetical protein IJS87_01205 [Rhodocyclaceae bacterium]|nr:hypothetical protein [Rhodocyclaceae bacterium]
MNRPPNPDCFRCQGLFITHERGMPYGCKIIGFRSLNLPSVEVRMSSGQPCLAFQPKPAKPGGKAPR